MSNLFFSLLTFCFGFGALSASEYSTELVHLAENASEHQAIGFAEVDLARGIVEVNVDINGELYLCPADEAKHLQGVYDVSVNAIEAFGDSFANVVLPLHRFFYSDTYDVALIAIEEVPVSHKAWDEIDVEAQSNQKLALMADEAANNVMGLSYYAGFVVNGEKSVRLSADESKVIVNVLPDQYPLFRLESGIKYDKHAGFIQRSDGAYTTSQQYDESDEDYAARVHTLDKAQNERGNKIVMGRKRTLEEVVRTIATPSWTCELMEAQFGWLDLFTERNLPGDPTKNDMVSWLQEALDKRVDSRGESAPLSISDR